MSFVMLSKRSFLTLQKKLGDILLWEVGLQKCDFSSTADQLKIRLN